jgi:hypothetical protein
VFCLVAGPATAECVEIKGMRLLADIDGAYEVREDRRGTLLVLQPDDRSLRTIRFRPRDIFGIVGGEMLENGMTIRFETSFEATVGSLGPTARLEGTLMTNPEPARLNYEISCASQGDYPDPKWCLSILGKLRTQSEGCSKEEE